MKNILAFIAMFAFVAIQFADIAILDTAPADSFELHTQSDQDKQALDDSEICCGCHSLRHIAVDGAACAAVHASLAGPKFPRDNASHEARGEGPPVPPPLA